MSSRRILWMVVVVGVAVGMWGCIKAVDPETGQIVRIVDPNVAATGEAVVQGVATAAPLFGPVGVGIGGVLTGLLAGWRAMRPSLTRAQAKSKQYYAVAASSVSAIEAFKEASPDQWDKLGGMLKEQMLKQNVDPIVVENVIRALRGLPAKA